MLNHVKQYKNKKFFILFNKINKFNLFRSKFQQSDFEANMINNSINIKKSLPKKILQNVKMIL